MKIFKKHLVYYISLFTVLVFGLFVLHNTTSKIVVEYVLVGVIGFLVLMLLF